MLPSHEEMIVSRALGAYTFENELMAMSIKKLDEPYKSFVQFIKKHGRSGNNLDYLKLAAKVIIDGPQPKWWKREWPPKEYLKIREDS